MNTRCMYGGTESLYCTPERILHCILSILEFKFKKKKKKKFSELIQWIFIKSLRTVDFINCRRQKYVHNILSLKRIACNTVWQHILC